MLPLGFGLGFRLGWFKCGVCLGLGLLSILYTRIEASTWVLLALLATQLWKKLVVFM